MITEKIIDNILKEKTSILAKGIVSAMQEPPQAIYLVGGYGRGEGAWYEDQSGIHPYNDFDLAVITDKPLSHNKTEILRKELAKEVGIKWVDIDYYSIATLQSLTPTIHNVDLLEGGSLIYGEDVINQNKITLNKQEIGKKDIIILYRTRMWTFLGSWEGSFRDLNVEETRFFKNQMAKAMLAANDMRLVKLKKYITSYRERAQLIKNEYKNDASITELTDWAINEKLRPSCSEMSKQTMEKLYFSIKREFLRAFDFSFGSDSSYFLNPYKTKFFYVFHTKTYLSHYYQLLKHRTSSVIRNVDVFFAMNFVLHANNNGVVDCRKLTKASDLLLKHGYINKANSSWDELRILTANARNNI